MAKNIYALLVGIIDYNQHILLDNERVRFPKLGGCVNDAKKIKSFLEKNYKEEQLHIKELYNSEATKEAICEQFLTHLGQAGEEDATLFYYSGHGTQEFADPCFITETDKRLESLAAYYDEQTTNNFLIADKELRYLIHKLSQNKATNTIIIDCCHSGEVTRNLEIVEENYKSKSPIEKKSSDLYAFSQRKWEQFIFHEQFKPEDVKQKGLPALLPEGNHILFSASESNESAFEIGGEGIFTKHFTDLLNAANGAISNQQLFDRIALCMKYGYVQKPRLYTPTSFDKLRTQAFLNTIGFMEGSTSVVFNSKKGWLINRGAINGLYAGLEITLYNSEDKTQTIQAVVETAAIDHAILKLPGTANTKNSYTADVDRLAQKTIPIYAALEDALPADAAALINAISASPAKIELVEEESKADFSLQHLAGMYYLTRPHDTYRPISAVVTGPDFELLSAQLQHLSKWQFINELTKKPQQNPGQLLAIEYSLNAATTQPLEQKDGLSQIKIEQWNETADAYTTSLQIKLTNKSSQELYVSVLYLDINFSSDAFLVEPSPYHLNAGEQVDLNLGGDPTLPVKFYTPALYYNYPQYSERFKIIVSDKPFEIYPLKLDPLPEPPLPAKMRSIDLMGAKRSIVSGVSNSLVGWYVTTIEMVCVNPAFNKIPVSRLQEMLHDELTGLFAAELFFINKANEPFNQEAELRTEITIIDNTPAIDALQERGAVIDIANWWSRRKRNNYFKDITRRFPERTVIVSEGDSWFQHPLVYDTIDHLSKIYAIRCVAAAADTLANYFSGAKKRGDYYLDVLTETKPTFFLISGGGNDILGSQFRDFLVDKPYDKGLKGSANGKDFLKESFGFQIDKLMDIYKSMFGLLQTQFPTMKTIVHGYDYPVHLDYPNKGWLGRYMIEKGIAEPADRHTVIKYILDEFNTRLAQVAANFTNTVYYLDLRNTVLYKSGEIDQWYDEIHPNIDGFQSVGLKFIQLIEGLKKA